VRFVKRAGYGEIQVNIDNQPDVDMIVKLSHVTSFQQSSLSGPIGKCANHFN
jgi:hypothetical protein